jgi:uncharacterized protein YyaL (SSP411 family)
MNRLKDEISPYLLQHADNPINWHPWDNRALMEAKHRDVPIFLSIGYSSCHWCHVMERQSFSDKEVAEALNSGFVCIKVDREERPDIDSLYMNFCHVLTGSGGWPLTIVMTPDLLPFYAATYLPKRGIGNIKGLIEVAETIKRLWRDHRGEIYSKAKEIFEHLKVVMSHTSWNYTLELSRLPEKAFQTLKDIYDPQNGGFGGKPKFPMPVYLNFLMAYHKVTGLNGPLEMVLNTLRAMRTGGIYDHVGKGFHRYATDEAWLVPHFEKLLYDQALLIGVYTEAYEITKNDLFKQTALETIGYVVGELYSPEGLFYTAEDADSEGEEGRFYTWTLDELRAALNSSEFSVIFDTYDLTSRGNFEDTGRNILYFRYPIRKGCKEVNPLLPEALKKLDHIRLSRPRPFKDRKSLTDWNALMILALVKAGEVFNDPGLIERAKKTACFIRDHLYDPQKGLMHLYMEGNKRAEGLLDDYAFYINSLLELHRVTSDRYHLELALELTEYVCGHFLNETGKAFYSSPETSKDLILRLQDITDNVIPSGNGVMMDNLLKLHRLTGNNRYYDLAMSIPYAMPATIGSSPASCCSILTALLTQLTP